MGNISNQTKPHHECNTADQAVYDDPSLGYVTINDQGLILEANDKAAQMLECKACDLKQHMMEPFVLDDDRVSFRYFMGRLLQKKEPLSTEVRLMGKDGVLVWTMMCATVFCDSMDTEVIHILLCDISEKKKRSADLTSAVNRYKVLMDLAVDGILLGDHEGYITEANERMCHLIGLSRDEFIGKHITTLSFTPESMAMAPFRFDLLHEGETVVSERGLSRPDGSEITVEIRTRMMPDGTYQSIYHDITHRKQTEDALREKEFFLTQSQKAAHIGSYSTDLKTRIWKASSETYRIFGIDESYPHTLDAWGALVHPDSRDELICYHLEVEADKKRFDVEYRIIKNDTGEVRWVHGLGELEYDHQSNPIRMTGTIQDITDRKYAETALRESEETYRTIFENTGTSMLLIEEDMTISKANSQFIINTGISPEEIGRIKWTDLAHPDDLNMMKNQHRIRRSNPGSGMPVYEIRFVTRKGELHYALLNIQIIPGTKRSVASLIDITRRREAEKKLMASEEKFRHLAESSPLAIMLHQGDRWIYANHAATVISGYSEEELYGMRFWDFIHPDYMDLIIKTGRNRQMGNDVPQAYEFKIIAKSGEEKWVSLTGSRINYEDNPTALIAVIDISERKRSEEEKQKLEKQLQQAQKMESIGRLAGGVAHDFNNMLGVIIGHTDLALMQADPMQRLYTNLKEIRKAAERSADLTRQLLAFARKQTIAPKIIDLNETVSGMLNMLRRLIGEDIHLLWEPAPDLWEVKMDPSQIDQILVNLCVNARDAIDGVGKMTIETGNSVLDDGYGATHAGFVPGEYVRISVSDDGCGMDRNTLGQIFEPFFTTKGVNKGTGLGLATVYGAVKQNNGYINAYSEPGHGSTFTIYLPRHAGKNMPSLKKTTGETAVKGHETILLVEDEPAILEVTTMILELQGYQVLTAGTPGEAIDLAGKYTGMIDLLLTDVVMPEMNGRELAKNLLSFYPDMKRLFMSGYTANVIAHHGVLDEGVHFIQKPFSSKELFEKIKEALLDDPV